MNIQFNKELFNEVKGINDESVWPNWLELFEKIKLVKSTTGQDFKVIIPLNKTHNMILGSDLPTWMFRKTERIDGDFKGYDYKPYYVGGRDVPTNPDLNKPDFQMASLFLKFKDQIYEELNFIMSQYLEENK